jgi:signal transduction histidine kinase
VGPGLEDERDVTGHSSATPTATAPRRDRPTGLGEQLHLQTRRPLTTLMMSAGVLVIAMASEVVAPRPFVAALVVYAAVYLVCVVGATVTITRGVYNPWYLAFNWTETAVHTIGVGLLMIAGGTPHSLLWLIYFSACLHGARAALYRRFNFTLFTLAPLIIASGFLWRSDIEAVLVSLALGASALYLHRLFLTASDREDALEMDREHLRRRIAALAITEERERIARDLHDGFGASLTAAVWQARRNSNVAEVAAIEDRLMACLDELGTLVWTTRRDDRARTALWQYMRTRCDDLFGAEVRIEYALPDRDDETPLDDRTAIAIMFIVFEALRNCVRHASAHDVRVIASTQASSMTVEIQNDGVGFDPATSERGYGLRNMEDRARSVGGTLEIQSTPGQTAITLRLPLPARATP